VLGFVEKRGHTAKSRSLPGLARAALGGGYLLAIVVCLDCEDAPRWLWTMAMPLVPFAVVVLGFHTWRRLCPLAAVAAVGSRLSRRRRRLPRWVDRWALLIAFVALLVGLLLRHVAINGDHAGLGCALALLALASILCNALFSGKTWCNVFCPVGIVERVYTDAAPLRSIAASGCERCTGCKAKCPDIDQNRAYSAELGYEARRISTYALPGLVLAFYAYYELRHGAWEAFFGGDWTLHELDVALVLGSGFVFAPRVPAVVAAALTLLAGSLASLLVFSAIEHGLRERCTDQELLRHRVLTIASFAAFNCFYLFAGQPTLRSFPVLDRVVAFVVPAVSTLLLARRWASQPRKPSGSRSLPVLQSTRGDAPHVPPSTHR
jgi:hypothetical protein